MEYRRVGRTTLRCVIGVLLMIAISSRSAEAIPLDNTAIDAATLCGMFDCGAGASSSSDTYSISPDPDPDGALASLVLPGIAAETAGTFLYAYQLTQDDASTAVINSLSVSFAGLGGSTFSFFCSDCGGTEAPSLVDFASDTITFSFAGLLAGQTSTLFGAISSAGPRAVVANVAGVEGSADVGALAPNAGGNVPEPASVVLFGVGIAGLALARRRSPARRR